jgi:hypothetical protein
MAPMVHDLAHNLAHHLVDKVHFVDKQTLARLNSGIVFGLVGTGLAACAFGAIVVDVGRWFSVW